MHFLMEVIGCRKLERVALRTSPKTVGEEVIIIELLRKIEKLMDLILRLDLADIIHLASS
jgi:uncharacterized ferredoxin-like protein